MALLQFKSVTKMYRKHFWTHRAAAVRDLSFDVDREGITGFVGPNGAGKTTSIKMLLGLVRPTAGTVLVRGLPSWVPEARRNVAYVPEQPSFYPYLTVQESMTFARRLYGRDSGETAVTRALETVELADHRGKLASELSKGMQQRLSMAQALASEADVFVLDEPMSGLDPLGRRLLRDVFRDLSGRGACVFFSTHSLEDVEALCARVVALSAGKVTYAGTVRELLDRGYHCTEVVTTAVGVDLRERLAGAGCSLEDGDASTVVITIPREQDPEGIIRIICEGGMVPRSITRRHMALDRILYPEAAGEVRT